MELEAAHTPEEGVVDTLLDLHLHDAADLGFGDQLPVHEDAAQELLLILLRGQGIPQLLFGDAVEGQEVLAQVLPWIRGPDAGDAALVEGHTLGVEGAAQFQDAGLLAHSEPLEDVLQPHRG